MRKAGTMTFECHAYENFGGEVNSPFVKSSKGLIGLPLQHPHIPPRAPPCAIITPHSE
jgi:hypothetical protein